MDLRSVLATSVVVLGVASPLASWAGTEACGGGTDSDCDGVPDVVDNCSLQPNESQCDADMDGYGNACDCDLNNSGSCSTLDIPPMKTALSTNDPIGDIDCSGSTDTGDIAPFKALLSRPPPLPPGPSGYPCAGTIPCP